MHGSGFFRSFPKMAKQMYQPNKSAMVVLALGSNIGDRMSALREAIKLIPLHNKLYSSVYESCALLPDNAPFCWNMPFLNMVIAGYTHFSPADLLQSVKQIESQLGRYSLGHWSPRSIDIDIILWEGVTVEDKALTIPHKEMHKRDFVLVPTCDICPRLPHPILKETVESILLKKQDINLVKKYQTIHL
ncbi:2-amino-4-hydroxy-6-hydroxymethyldihydropteridinepyrophosphokinase [Anaplasma phagocytophilum]|nr:2-amino-4-hydroxy-6-hydroxymethyldihydropteridinepyrophosphokinase [Anaplasma phagocytophilum]SCV66118.1 2-amino-4-hydroxy-6-hydroxymethyldihydropteridinepyrophosphokinase [Anaplasma phagocytophilum]SCV66501.1 2-amino-4-hydroxy-6-hydroxymethyldihydropteridinepyrophosphokinase [Anaplasma phagocytophilum]